MSPTGVGEAEGNGVAVAIGVAVAFGVPPGVGVDPGDAEGRGVGDADPDVPGLEVDGLGVSDVEGLLPLAT